MDIQFLQTVFQKADQVIDIKNISSEDMVALRVPASEQVRLRHSISCQKQKVYVQVQERATCILTSEDMNLEFLDTNYEVEFVIVLEQFAKLQLFFSSLSLPYVSYTVSVYLQGNSSQAEIHGLYALNKDQKVSIKTYQYHNGADTKSNLVIKGMLKDCARASYQGLIKIDESAQAADAAQENKNIVLSKEAKVVSIPSIEVLQHDVQCCHGSAIGNFEDTHIWYLQSKGLTKEQSYTLLIKSFFQDVLSGTSHKEKIEESICEKML